MVKPRFSIIFSRLSPGFPLGSSPFSGQSDAEAVAVKAAVTAAAKAAAAAKGGKDGAQGPSGLGDGGGEILFKIDEFNGIIQSINGI